MKLEQYEKEVSSWEWDHSTGPWPCVNLGASMHGTTFPLAGLQQQGTHAAL